MATEVKDQIAETFTRLAKKSGLDKVTVSAIVSECGISRQAFYYYYQDIMDVARYILKKNLTLSQHTGEEAKNPGEAVKSFAAEFTAQFPYISLALNSRMRREMELLLIRELKSFFHCIFTRQNCGRDLSRAQIEFQSDLIACGLSAYALEHCEDLHFDQAFFSQALWEMFQRTYGSR